MSYEDLEEHNVFLPEAVWGKVELSASVNQVLLTGVMLTGVAGCVMMWLGGGSALTWWGAGLFILFLYAFLWVSNAGIESQNKEIDELIEKHR
jgi:hypothetical protein